MDWTTIITAGVISTLVSSLVSVATAVFLHRYKVRKDRFDSYFDRLIALKQQIDDVPNFDMTPMLARGHANGEDMRQALQLFQAIDGIYLPNEMLFEADLRAKVDSKRLPVVRAITEAAQEGMAREINGGKMGSESLNPVNAVYEEIFTFPGAVRDVIEAQIDRIRI